MFTIKTKNITIICHEERQLFALLFIGGIKQIKNPKEPFKQLEIWK